MVSEETELDRKEREGCRERGKKRERERDMMMIVLICNLLAVVRILEF